MNRENNAIDKKEAAIGEIEELISEVDSLPFDDYNASVKVIKKLKMFFGNYYILFDNPYTLEDLDQIKYQFEKTKNTKKWEAKVKLWNAAALLLKIRIDDLKDILE